MVRNALVIYVMKSESMRQYVIKGLGKGKAIPV